MNIPFTIGVAGHVDHGKTTLVKALTGIDTDRKAQEKARGLSIESGVARLNLPGGRSVALIDVPGHTDFLKNTIRGLNSVDLAVLVVAADDGVMPQTREHLDILSFFKAKAGWVVLTKCDLVDEETLEVAELEVSELLKGTFLEDCPVYRFSSQKPELGTRIVKGLDSRLAQLSAKKSEAPFRLWIDQAKSIPGHGTVVSGTVASGAIHLNDEISLLPAGKKTRARSLETHACTVTQAVAGQRVGINLHRVAVYEALRGMSLAAPETIAATFLLNANIHVLPRAVSGIKNRQKVKLYLGTAITRAMVVLTAGERLEPGDSGLVQIRLMQPVAALPRDSFVISPLNLNTVIAGGIVLETPREKFRAAKSQHMLPLLTALAKADPAAFLKQIFAQAKSRLITAHTLARKTGLPQADFERLISSKVQKGELAYIKGRGAIQKDHLAALEREFLAIVQKAFKKDPLKKNIGLKEVEKQLGHPLEEALLKAVADRLVKAAQIERLEGGFILSKAESVLDTQKEELMAQLLDYAQTTGLTPFSADTFWKAHQKRHDKAVISQLLNYLYSRKKVVRLNDKRYLSLAAVETIKKRVAATAAEKGFVTVGDCKQLLGYGRWGGTHVFDYLDQIGFTMRKEDKHYLAKPEV